MSKGELIASSSMATNYSVPFGDRTLDAAKMIDHIQSLTDHVAGMLIVMNCDDMAKDLYKSLAACWKKSGDV